MRKLAVSVPLSGQAKYSVEPERLSAPHGYFKNALNVLGRPEHSEFGVS